MNHLDEVDKFCHREVHVIASQKRDVVLIIPGAEFTQKMERLYKAIGVEFALMKYVVVFVDWWHLQLRFEFAVANARGIAIQIRDYLLSEMASAGEVDFHIIGAGIGAHIAGYIGQTMKVTRIT